MKTVWTAYRHVVEEFDARDVEAESDREAARIAAEQLRAEQWPASLRDELVIDSQEVVERRYTLDLSSDADDLDIEEVD